MFVPVSRTKFMPVSETFCNNVRSKEKFNIASSSFPAKDASFSLHCEVSSSFPVTHTSGLGFGLTGKDKHRRQAYNNPSSALSQWNQTPTCGIEGVYDDQTAPSFGKQFQISPSSRCRRLGEDKGRVAPCSDPNLPRKPSELLDISLIIWREPHGNSRCLLWVGVEWNAGVPQSTSWWTPSPRRQMQEGNAFYHKTRDAISWTMADPREVPQRSGYEDVSE